MTFENALAKIQAKFAEVNGAKLADMAVQVTLTDEDCGGTLYFKVTDGTVDVQGYDYRDHDAAIDIERKSFMDILGGKTTLDNAIEKGKATGNGKATEKLATLKDAVPTAVKKVVEKKAPAKKAPAKKAPAKKAEVKPAAKKAEAKPVEKKAEAKPAEKKAPAVKKAAAKPAEKKAPVAKKTATKTAAKKA